MTTMVEFEVDGVRYCLPVAAARAVRSSAGLVPLPSPAPSVAGLLPGDPPLTVISPFGSAGLHVLVLEVEEGVCGLLVDSVTGLRRVDDADIRPAPRGQHDELVSGSVLIDGAMVLLADPQAVAHVPDHGSH